MPNKEFQTDRRKELVDPRLMLAAIVESTDDAIISKLLDGTITSWNRAAEKLFGYTADEMIGESVLILVPPALDTEEREIQNKVRAGQRLESYSTERVDKQGHAKHVAVTISPIYDENNLVIGASSIIRDDTARQASEEVRAKLAAIVESSDDAIIGKNLRGIITSWNAGAERLFGYTAAEMLGQSVLKLIPTHLHDEEPAFLRLLVANQRIDHFETQRLTSSGKLIDVSLTISPIRDGRGTVIGASKIARDITERKLTQVALMQAEKLSVTGRMAAALAHEVNNPLQSIADLAFLLTNEPSLDDEARKYAKLLLSEISRASDITRKTLSFYRASTKPASVNVSEVLDDVVDLHRPRLNTIRVVRDFDKSASVWGFAAELRQVFLNLLLNAVDAIGLTGEIRLRLRTAKERVTISVSDDGCGIPWQARRKIFQPFFTTKDSKGNGLGLWVSKGIVEKHEGWIRMRSSCSPIRHGTTFLVTFPKHTVLEG